MEKRDTLPLLDSLSLNKKLTFSPAGLHRSDRILAEAHGGHPVRVGLLRDSLPEALLPRHSPVRDQGDDSENQTTPNGNGRSHSERGGLRPTAGAAGKMGV